MRVIIKLKNVTVIYILIMNEYITGGVSGICQAMVGHPFDTYKVMMQNNKLNINTIKTTNPFRGIKYPMMSSVIVCSLTFGIHNHCKKELKLRDWFSGFIAGTMATPLCYIADYGKIKAQMNMPIKWNYIFKNKGMFSTFLRESIAFSAYFETYNYFKTHKYPILLSGALAGLCNWTLSYPFDVIRTRQVAYDLTLKQAYNMGKLWKGYLPCAMRAIKVNAVGFYVYDSLNDILNKKIENQ